MDDLRRLRVAAQRLLDETPPYVMGRNAYVGVRLGLLMDLRDALAAPKDRRTNEQQMIDGDRLPLKEQPRAALAAPAADGLEHECSANEQCRQYASDQVAEALAGDDW